MVSKIQSALYDRWGLRVSSTLITMVPILLILGIVLMVQLSTRTLVEDLTPQEQARFEKEMEDDLKALENDLF